MLRFNPPTYFLISIILSLGAHFIWPVVGIIDWPYRWLGVVLIVAGGWVTVWADGVFKRVNTTVKPQEKPTVLVAQGPFRISRHPMYLGMTLIVLGVAVLLGSLSAFFGPILIWLILQFVFIPYEETKMAATFGGAYDDYRGRTRMWL
jgi:protein-S-isoprenylcysteine O-methyltransferase Ste14